MFYRRLSPFYFLMFHRRLSLFIYPLTFHRRLSPFWAAAPKGRCSVECRGYFVRPSVRPSIPQAPAPCILQNITPLGPPPAQASQPRPSGPGPLAQASRPRPPGLGLSAQALRPRPHRPQPSQGWMDGWTKYPLHSTEHRPFGAAAQKGRRRGRRKRGRKITRYKYSKEKESQGEEEEKDDGDHLYTVTSGPQTIYGQR